MNKLKIIITFTVTLSICQSAFSYCPYDHLFIGCNEDGIEGTEDDLKLFVDCRHKYKDVENTGDRFYTLTVSGDPCEYIKLGPGYDEITDDLNADHPVKDPNRSLEGTRNSDYQIWVECISISDNFKTQNLSGTILLENPGDKFNHSDPELLPYTHMHLYYVWTSSEPYLEPNEMQWITYYLWDAKGKYGPSEPFSVAYVQEPLAGDLELNGVIDMNDLGEMAYYWLGPDASSKNDYYERADCDLSGDVNMVDFAYLASNWMFESD